MNLVITVVETKEFPSWTAFISWKEEEESNTHTCFVKPKGESEGSNEHTGHKNTLHVATNCSQALWLSLHFNTQSQA